MGIKVFFNNSCSVCRLEINHYKKISDSNLEWIDITNNDEALKLTSKSQEELFLEQYLTFSQFNLHFFLQVKDFLQIGQIFEGKLCFFI